MTDHDVLMAAPSTGASEGRPDRSIAEQLVEQARADGVDLVGPGGLLAGLTKQVLEAGLEVEMERPCRLCQTRGRSPQSRQQPQRDTIEDSDHRGRPGRDRGAS